MDRSRGSVAVGKKLRKAHNRGKEELRRFGCQRATAVVSLPPIPPELQQSPVRGKGLPSLYVRKGPLRASRHGSSYRAGITVADRY